MFQFAPEYQKDLEAAKSKLEDLVHQIPGLIDIEVGLNCLANKRAMDLVLTAHMKDMDDLNAYQTHPAHLEVATYIKERSILVKSVDY